MKVVALHTDFRIYWPARLKALQAYLKERDIELEVIEIAGAGSPYAFAEKAQNGEPSWHILYPKARMEDLSPQAIKPKLYRLLDALNPDVIIAGAIAFPSGALAVSWSVSRGRKVVSFDDTKAELLQRSGLTNFIKQCVYKGVDAMFYPAPEWQSTGEHWNFLPEQLYYGVDVVDNEFWREAPKYKELGSFYLAVGRQLNRKNYSILIAAYRRYQGRVGESAINLILIGEGPMHETLQAEAGDLVEKGKIQFLPFMQQAELRTYFQQCEAFVLPSIEETWGLVINEAMASGAPILSSKQCGATSVLVQDGRNGFTFDCMDVDILYEGLCRIHEMDAAQRTAMKEASLGIIAEWGLNKFCEGAYGAIAYVTSHPKRKINLIERLIIKMWKGRYRPK